MKKETIHQEDIKLNINGPNLGAPKYTKQFSTDLKGEIGNNTLIVGDFDTILTAMGTSSRQELTGKYGPQMTYWTGWT